jgi:hypothetical protein
MHPEIQRLLASLPAIVRQDLSGWNSPEALGTPKPALRVPGANSDRYYGDVKWKAELRLTLLHHFPKGHAPRPPLVTTRSVATSEALVKSTDLLSRWQEYARGVAAVEMELGGVFLAARQIDREHPILAIRGISDIVGFKREEQWTKYACTTAAAFAYALVRAGAAFEPRIAEMSGGSQTLLEQATPDGSPVGEVHLVYLPRETSFDYGPWPNKNIGWRNVDGQSAEATKIFAYCEHSCARVGAARKLKVTSTRAWRRNKISVYQLLFRFLNQRSTLA